MKAAVSLLVSAWFILAVLVGAAEAIRITLADVQNGVAVVEGNQAARHATVTWEGSNVTQTTRGGTFSFSGIVPADCVGTLSDGVHTIEVALPNCTVPPPPSTGGVLATGQTQCDQGDFTLGGCPGTPAGQDGELQKGAARSYTDNGDGTITDNATGLMWEKLTNDATIHDVNNFYTWAEAFQKITDLNTANFAGHNDWRLPNFNELLSLADYGRVDPAIDTAFNRTDSFTVSAVYWSSTTYQFSPFLTWGVHFFDGAVTAIPKTLPFLVRAVRGGS